jgi:hypothetical protein
MACGGWCRNTVSKPRLVYTSRCDNDARCSDGDVTTTSVDASERSASIAVGCAGSASGNASAPLLWAMAR